MIRRHVLTAALAGALLAPATAVAQGLRSEADRAVGATTTAVHVADARSGRTLYARRATARRPLGSTTKLLTGLAALRRVPALRTTVLATGPLQPDGTLAGDLVLRGGGDPTFGTPRASLLADAVVRAGVRAVSGAVVADETLFDAVRGGPSTGGAFDPELGAPLSALSFDGGRETPGGPVRADAIEVAARTFDDLLEARGVRLPNLPRAGTGQGAVLAAVAAPATATLVRRMLRSSDDFVAEMLAKAVAASTGQPGSTTLGTRLVAVPGIRLVDGSGLDRRNTGSARALTAVVRRYRSRSDLLAAPGQGTLRTRLRGLRCRAKTGTLDRVSNVAGLCTTRGGRRVAFAVLASSRARADRVVRALARSR